MNYIMYFLFAIYIALLYIKMSSRATTTQILKVICSDLWKPEIANHQIDVIISLDAEKANIPSL